MKRINNLFRKVVVYNNFLLADSNARKNKKHYKEINNANKIIADKVNKNLSSWYKEYWKYEGGK